MATEKTASFTIPIKVESNAREGAEDLETLRAKIASSQDQVKAYGAAMRALRGATDEVKSARADLKAKLDIERDALSRNNLALVKQGTTYEHVSKTARENAKAALEAAKSTNANKAANEATAKAVKAVGGPMQALHERLDSVKTVLGGATTASGAMAVASAALAAGALVAVTAVAALTAALVAGTVAFASFVLEGANWNRTAGLMREAASGSATNATALGHQVDALAGKVSSSKAELNELALTMTRSLLGTRVSGQGLVDTFNAIGQAAAANGGQAAAKLQEIIERGKTWGRIGIGLQELQGTGITFEDVAGNLAKQLKVGLDVARQQLYYGVVDVNQGAKAIRDAVEKRFAAINLAKMLDLDVLKVKFKDTLTALTSGVDLTPLLKSLQSLGDLFSASTVTGAALRDIVTDFGTVLVGKGASGVDAFKSAIKGMVIWALKVDVEITRNKKTIEAWIDRVKSAIDIKAILTGVTAVVVGLTVAFGALALATIGVWGPFAALGVAAGALVEFGPKIVAAWDAVNDWAKGVGASMRDLGMSIIQGITQGLRDGWNALKAAVSGVAESVKDTFKGLLGIHSPSLVFQQYGQQTTEGYARGLDQGTPGIQASTDAMVPQAPPQAAGRGGGGPISVTVQLNVQGGGSGADTAKAIQAPDFLASLTRAIEDALIGAGIPTQQAAGA